MDYRSPQSAEDFEAYFRLRWEVLRKPWGHEEGAVKGDDDDDDEEESFHLMAIEDGRILGVGRLHAIEDSRMQIRYMGVVAEAQGRGVGMGLMVGLEDEARRRGASGILLHARASAVPFYEKNGYGIVAESYLLWGEIQHFMMTKSL